MHGLESIEVLLCVLVIWLQGWSPRDPMPRDGVCLHACVVTTDAPACLLVAGGRVSTDCGLTPADANALVGVLPCLTLLETVEIQRRWEMMGGAAGGWSCWMWRTWSVTRQVFLCRQRAAWYTLRAGNCGRHAPLQGHLFGHLPCVCAPVCWVFLSRWLRPAAMRVCAAAQIPPS